MKKRMISLLLSFVLLFGLLPQIALPVKADASGICGDNLTWSVDSGTGTLTISGTGPMTDWEGIGDSPWAQAWALYSVSHVVIEEGVTSIGSYAFAWASLIETVSLPSSLVRIGKSAFEDVEVSEIDLPSGLTTIEDEAFWGAHLEEMTLPGGLISIGERAFASTWLEHVTIPAGVNHIGQSAFADCKSLTGIDVDGANPFFSSEGGVLFDKNKTTLLQYPCGLGTSYNTPNTVKRMGDYAFSGNSKLTNVTISDGATEIGSYAFSDCTNLVSLSVPESVVTIGAGAFKDCKSLRSITIPSGVKCIEPGTFDGCQSLAALPLSGSVTTIGRGAFSNCIGLTVLEIPASVTTIGDGAFSGCSGLTSIQVDVGNPSYSSSGGLLLNADGTRLLQCPAGISNACAIPYGVIEIGDGAFYGCKKLTEVTLPNSVVSIGREAFMRCTKLRSVDFSNNLESIDWRAFEECTELQAVILPDSLKQMASSVFWDCEELQHVTLSNNLRYIPSFTFHNCAALTEVVIPDSVEVIGTDAFSSCSNLRSVTFGSKLRRIESEAFEYCEGLRTVLIPQNVEYIGESAFRYCYNLLSVRVLNDDCEIQDGWVYEETSYGQNIYIPAYTLGERGYTTVYGNRGSSAEKYAAEYGYAFRLLSEFTVQVKERPIYSSQVGFSVIDRSTKKPVADVEIKAVTKHNGIVLKGSTGDDGMLVVDGVGGEYNVTCTKEGYITETVAKSLRRGKACCIVLTPITDAPTVYSAEATCDGKEYDLLQSKLVIYETSDQTLTITAHAGYKQDAGIQEYRLVQDGTVKKTSTDGVFSDLSAADFSVSSSIYLVAVGTDGKTGPYAKTGLMVEDNPFAGQSSGTSAEIHLADSVTFTVSSDIPLLGGMEIGIDLADFPAYVETDGDSFKVAVNCFSSDAEEGLGGVFKDDTTWATFKEGIAKKMDPKQYMDSMKDLLGSLKQANGKDIPIGKGKSKLGYDLWGYLEGTLSSGDISGEIALNMEAKIGREYQQIAFGVPIVISLEISGKMDSSVKASGNLDSLSKLKLTGKITPSISIGAGIGPGFAGVASATVNGKGTLGIDYTFDPDVRNSFRSWLKASLYTKVKIAFAEWTLPMAEQTYELYNSLDNKHGSENDALAGYMDLTNYSIADRSYAASQTPWRSEPPERGAGVRLQKLQSSIYSDTRIQVVQTDDLTMAFFLTDAPERSDVDRTMLVCSIYQPGSGWGEPFPVEDDGTADFMPMAVKNGSDIWVTWMNLKEAVGTQEHSFEEIAALGDISLAKYDREDGSFELTTITDESGMDTAPYLTFVQNQPCVSWIQNGRNNLLLNDHTNSVRLYNGATDEQITLANNMENVVELAVTAIDGEPVAAVICDDDGDYGTMDDRRMIALRAGDNTQYTLAENCVLAELQAKNGRFTWYQDALLYMTDSVTNEAEPLLGLDKPIAGTYQILESGSKTWVVFAGNVSEEDEARTNVELFAYVYDNGKWGDAVRLTNLSQTILDFAAFEDENGLQLLASAAQIQEEDGTFSETVSLYAQKPETAVDYALLELNCGDAVLGEDGIEVDYEVTLQNIGLLNGGSCTLDLLYEGQTVDSVLVSNGLASGEICTVTGTFHADEVVGPSSVYNVIVNSSEDTNASNDSQSVILGQEKLLAEISDAAICDDNYIMMVSITNDGLFPVDKTVKLALNGKQNEPLFKSEVSLDVDQSIQLCYTIDATAIDFETTASLIGVYLGDDTFSRATYAIYKPHAHNLEITGEPVEPTCTEPGRSADTYCSICGEMSRMGDLIDALGHEWDGGSVTLAPTDSECGRWTYTCERCGSTDNWVMPPVPTEPAVPQNPFTDVRDSSYYFKPVLWASSNGVTSGTSETTFSPNMPCTRAQFVTFLWRLDDCPEPESVETPFTDVPRSSYYAKAVSWAYECGITSGTSASTFSPNSLCSRSQAITLLWRYCGSNEVESASSFVDVPETSYYANAVKWAVYWGITTGTSETTFSPNNVCTRSQAVTFLYRLFGSDSPNPEPLPFTAIRVNPMSILCGDQYYRSSIKYDVLSSEGNVETLGYWEMQDQYGVDSWLDDEDLLLSEEGIHDTQLTIYSRSGLCFNLPITVTVIGNPLERIEVPDQELIENYDLEMNMNPEDNSLSPDGYYLSVTEKARFYLKTGEILDGTYALSEYLHEKYGLQNSYSYSFYCKDGDNDSADWEPGETRTYVFKIYGFQTEFNVSIVPSPIQSFGLLQKEVDLQEHTYVSTVSYGDGDVYNSVEIFDFYSFIEDHSDLFSAVLLNGEQFDYNQWIADHDSSPFKTYILIDGKLYEEFDYQLRNIYHPFQAGDSVTIRINLLGKEADLVVHIVPSAEESS